MWQANLKALLLSWLSLRFRRWPQAPSIRRVKTPLEKDVAQTQVTNQTEDFLSARQQPLTNELASPPADWLARQSAGPPAHWIERVRQGGAYQLLEEEEPLPQLHDGENIRPALLPPRPAQMPQPPPLRLQKIKATEGISMSETRGEELRISKSAQVINKSLRTLERERSAQFHSQAEGQNKPQSASQNPRWQWPENSFGQAQNSDGIAFKNSEVHQGVTDNNEVKVGAEVNQRFISKTLQSEAELQNIEIRQSQNNEARLTFSKTREVREKDAPPRVSSANLKNSPWQKSFRDEQSRNELEGKTKSSVGSPGLPKILFDRSRIQLEDEKYNYPQINFRQEKKSQPVTQSNRWVEPDQAAPNYQLSTEQWPELPESPDTDQLNEMMNRWRDARRQQRLNDEQLGISWSE